ncbi:hypothetical protein CR513_59720, partial [Mucuna pruriens]
DKLRVCFDVPLSPFFNECFVGQFDDFYRYFRGQFPRESMEELVKKFKDVFPQYVPHGLPPLRGIKHHIDLNLGVALSNRDTYRMNQEESKEIKK